MTVFSANDRLARSSRTATGQRRIAGQPGGAGCMSKRTPRGVSARGSLPFLLGGGGRKLLTHRSRLPQDVHPAAKSRTRIRARMFQLKLTRIRGFLAVLLFVFFMSAQHSLVVFFADSIFGLARGVIEVVWRKDHLLVFAAPFKSCCPDQSKNAQVVKGKLFFCPPIIPAGKLLSLKFV